MQRARTITESQRDAAAAWLARIGDGAADAATLRAFRLWLDADPRHRQAYDDAKAMWGALEEPARRLARRRPADVPSRRPGLRGLSTRLLRAMRRPATALPAMAAAAICAVALWIAGPALVTDLGADAVTARGELHDVTLPDGSVVHLAADSAVSFSFADGRRQVSLMRGQAFFEVRSGRSAPFVVDAGAARIRVIGTAFNVDRADGRIDVAVAAGAVDVSGDGSEDAARLRSGQRVRLTHGRLSAVQPAALRDVTAWREGRLVFHREPLSRVVATLQRHRSGRIVIAGRGLAQTGVSGVFPAGDVDSTLAALAASIGFDVLSVTPWLTIIH